MTVSCFVVPRTATAAPFITAMMMSAADSYTSSVASRATVPTTTQGEITTTQGEIMTTQGEITTAQGEITTTQGKITTTQGEITTTASILYGMTVFYFPSIYHYQ